MPKQIDLLSGKSLGYYLVCVSLCESCYQFWTVISGSVDQGLSRLGFRVFVGVLASERTVENVYRASIVWLFALAVGFLRERLPLKAYIKGEILLGFPTVVILFAVSSGQSLTSQLMVVGVFLFESAIPVLWAAVLLQRTRKSEPRHVPVSVRKGTRALGYYLVGLSAYQVAFFGVFAFSGLQDRFGQLYVGLYPRTALFFASDLFQSILNEEIWPDLRNVVWLLELCLALLMICGRQPLKTYIVTESALGIPAAALIGMLWYSTAHFSLFTRLLTTAVFLLVSVIPVAWACRLLWMKRTSALENHCRMRA